MKKILMIIGFLITSSVCNAQTVDLYANYGTYLGNTGNSLDPNSINNPLGKYGSNLSTTSPNNDFAKPARAIDWNNKTYKCVGGNSFGGC